MNKAEFAYALRQALGKLPAAEVEQSVAFYLEAIDDRMEDGATEQEAVAALGDVNDIAAHIIAETPVIPKAIARANTGSRTLNIVLLVVFSPIWVPVVFALALAAASVYLSLWLVVASLWITVGLMMVSGPLGVAVALFLAATGHPLTAAFELGAGLAVCGVGLFALYGVAAASKALVGVTRRFSRWIKGLFVKEERHA